MALWGCESGTSVITTQIDAEPKNHVAQNVTAGTPFIIKWDESGDDITNPVFEGVTVSNATNNATIAGVLTFTGTYAPVSIADVGGNAGLNSISAGSGPARSRSYSDWNDEE